MPTVVNVSDQVRELVASLGAADPAAAYTAHVRSGGRCFLCGRALPPGGPAEAVILRDRDKPDRLVYTDSRCMRSGVYDIPPSVDEDDDAGHPMSVSAWVVAHGADMLPAVVCEVPEDSPDAALLLPALRRRGFGRLRSIGRWVPAPAPRWSATARPGDDGRCQLDIHSYDAAFFTGALGTVPARWYAEVRSRGWCILYIAHCSLSDAVNTGSNLDQLAAAAAVGDLVAARIPMTLLAGSAAANTARPVDHR